MRSKRDKHDEPGDEPTADAAAAQPVQGLEALGEIEEQASRQIRKGWHDGRWFFSVVDAVGLLTASPTPRVYWGVLKHRLEDEGASEVFTNCKQLKLTAADGKQRLTDCADQETLLRIVQSIPSPKAEPFKRWLARVGSERIEEIESPERMADRLRQQYRRAGYSTEWINARLRNILTRDELTDEWRERGVHEGSQFAKLTDIQHQGWSGITTAEHKAFKQLPKRANLRDNETTLELALETLTEATATALHQEHDSQGMPALADDARRAGRVGGAARRDVEAALGRPVVSAENAKSLTARAIQPDLFMAAASAASAAGGDAQPSLTPPGFTCPCCGLEFEDRSLRGVTCRNCGQLVCTACFAYVPDPDPFDEPSVVRPAADLHWCKRCMYGRCDHL